MVISGRRMPLWKKFELVRDRALRHLEADLPGIGMADAVRQRIGRTGQKEPGGQNDRTKRRNPARDAMKRGKSPCVVLQVIRSRRDEAPQFGRSLERFKTQSL